MNKIEGQQNPIRSLGLTEDEINWPLAGGLHTREMLKRFVSGLDFIKEAEEARYQPNVQGRDHGYNLDIRIQPEVKKFLEDNRPKALFSQPENIVSLLTPDSDIVLANHFKDAEFEHWQFSLNPQRFEEKGTITFSRHRTGRQFGNPYIYVYFPAFYDGSRVIFRPKISIYSQDHLPREALDETLLKLLGIKEHAVDQKLNFEVKRERQRIFYRDETQKRRFITWSTYPVEISLK